MVSIKEESDYDKLDRIVETVCKAQDLTLYVDGWTRKTYRIYDQDPTTRQKSQLLQIESLITTNGELYYLSDDAIGLAKLMGEALEKEFDIEIFLVKKQAE